MWFFYLFGKERSAAPPALSCSSELEEILLTHPQVILKAMTSHLLRSDGVNMVRIMFDVDSHNVTIVMLIYSENLNFYLCYNNDFSVV